MKKKIYTLFLLLFLGITLQSNAQLAPMYGNDKFIEGWHGAVIKSHIAVADNGWIYILAQVNKADGSQRWELYCSKDDGFTYSLIKYWGYNGTDWELIDCDLVVTGNDESNIAVWVAEVANASDLKNSYARVQKFDADGIYLATPFEYKTNVKKIFYSISISTDYRSPATEGSPFSIAMAYTYNYDDGSILGKDYLTYAYSTDGGANFIDKDVYSHAGAVYLGKCDVSIGAHMGAVAGTSVIAFETNRSGDLYDIGLLVNDYKFAISGWSDNPLIVNGLNAASINKCKNPTVQVMSNVTTSANYNFLIAFEEYSDIDGDIMMIHPKSTFSPFGAPNLDKFEYTFLATGDNEINPYLAYDKANNNYLLTYVKDNSLMYKVLPYSQIGNASLSWSDIGNYRDATSEITWNAYPSVDINPTKTQACFSWTETGGEEIFADAEWLHYGINAEGTTENTISVYPNPCKNEVKISLEKPDNYLLEIFNMQGVKVKEYNIDGSELHTNIGNLPKGMYVLKATSSQYQYTTKVLVN